MSVRVQCPLPEFPDAWIDLPDTWLGKHAQRRDETIEKSPAKWGVTLISFAVSMALLDDWSLPGIEGNKEKWDFEVIELGIIGWVNSIVLTEFQACFEVPKVSSSP